MPNDQAGPGGSAQDHTQTLLRFLDEIGIPWVEGPLDDNTFLPGLAVRAGRLFVDRARLAYPGDILHEAGHIALTPGAQRPGLGPDELGDAGLEIAALAWSYAAAVHIGLPPEVVFHEHGYKGQSAQIVQALKDGATLGQPVLAWLGMTEFGTNAGAEWKFPKMRKWLRD